MLRQQLKKRSSVSVEGAKLLDSIARSLGNHRNLALQKDYGRQVSEVALLGSMN
jgi:hypothetical protein